MAYGSPIDDSASDTGTGPRLLVVAVGKRLAFRHAVAAALADLASESARTAVGGDRAADPRPWPAEYQQAVTRSRRLLDRVLPAAELRLVTGDTLTQAADRLRSVAAAGVGRHQAVALVLLDAAAASVPAGVLDHGLDDGFGELRAALPADVACELSSYTFFVYDDAPPDRVRVAFPYTRRQPPDTPWVLAADVVCSFTDYVQFCFAGAAFRPPSRTAPTVLARELSAFLDARAGATWGLHYYTGSVVSGLIADLEALAVGAGNPVLRGPSEHSLACGALARWQLDGAPFLIVVTSGMVDEFRGTLANLREARARGFIVCADSRPGTWFPFQGTVHTAEDSREVLRARGLAWGHLEDPAQLADDLRRAFAAYEADRGPVVLLATPEVLEAVATGSHPVAAEFPAGGPAEPASGGPADIAVHAPARAAAAVPRAAVAEDAMTPVMEIVNNGPARLLWQCGALGAEEHGLVHEIATAAGIGLADSLTRPGSVAKYRGGRTVDEYLGTLGLYGYSARVHEFLHSGGRLRPRADQCVFFVKSRIAEAATPFSARALDRMLRIVQVTREPEHLAPFADHHVLADSLDFLREVRRRLDVRPEVLADRRDALAATADSASDMLHALPLMPMSPNYFFRRLGAVLEELITARGYTYTGVYDVGRGGLSAIRNLPRTGPGFSGWYGRALMGDALQAVPAIALSRHGNVLAFIGDGASALVPDIVPTLVQQVCVNGLRLPGNLSIFRLIDGGHSVIRSYREGRSAAAAGRQTQVLHLLDDEGEWSFGPLTVAHRHLHDVDPPALRDQLRHSGTVNLYSVLLAHNNEGDGLSLLSSLGWQRDTLPELAFAIARQPRTATRAGGVR
jgi:3-acetyloctanal synthase